jgi:heparanase 1
VPVLTHTPSCPLARLLSGQDFVGIDYGMIDCSTYEPLPDYYTSILWSSTMGAKVLMASTNDTTSMLRAYAHCTTARRSKLIPDLPGALPSGSVTLLLLNLNQDTNVTVSGLSLQQTWLDGTASASAVRYEYHLTAGSDGLGGTGTTLNGQPLRMGGDFTLPEMPTRTAKASDSVVLAPASIAFIVLPDANAAACK